MFKTALAALLLLFLADALAEGVNPFARPARDQVRVAAPDAQTASEQIELRGVIEAGSDSIANLNGILLAIGEESNGYRLESVAEDSATFLREGKQITLELIEQARGANDE